MKICVECKQEITEIGFECETFAVCKKCCDEETEAWEEFQIVMQKEIQYLEAHSAFCRMLAEK